MRERLGFLLVLLYLSLDLSNPLMPGALSFEAADSVDAAGRVRVRSDAVAAPASAPRASRLDRAAAPPLARARPAPLVARPVVSVAGPRAHLPESTPGSPTDDD
jgi:hypothetical protein